jgi:Ca2+-binding EF-hand superfamily protein
MRRFHAVVASLTLLALIAGSAFVLAQMPDRDAMMASAAKKAFQKILAEADKNHDGKISKEEFMPLYKDPAKAEKNYKAWDLNQDGFITEEEYIKAAVSMAQPRK